MRPFFVLFGEESRDALLAVLVDKNGAYQGRGRRAVPGSREPLRLLSRGGQNTFATFSIPSVARIAGAPWTAGAISDRNGERIGGTVAIVDEPVARGRIVAFVEGATFRGFVVELHAFLNAAIHGSTL